MMYLRQKRGFSLMELVVTVAIIIILSSTAYVSWKKYVRKAIRSEAKVSLSMISSSQNQYRATCNTYYPNLRTIGALPKGKLYFNAGGVGDSTVSNWGSCLTNTADANKDTHFYTNSSSTQNICCNSEADFENVNKDCPCFIREDYRLDKSKMMSNHTPSEHCGSTFANGSILKNKFCILATTAINRNKTNKAEWEVWAVNHLNIVKQVHSPGD